MHKGMDVDKPLVALCPFANVQAREWPLEYVSALAQRLTRCTQVILLGGAKDSAKAEAVVRSAPALIDGCGTFSVGQSAAMLSLCRLAVVMDSGPMHLASAVGTPSVVVYSRYDRIGRWLPLGSGHTILYRDMPCAGCREPVCPVAGHPCMSEIQVADVFDAVMRKMHGREWNSEKPRGTRILNL
jgi:ADP-heptose:LPS heptosyltransferase